MDTNATGTRPDMTCPIWTIEHLAAAFAVSVETAREYASRSDFPGARVLGTRLLWDSAEVQAWFLALPKRTAADRRRTTAPAQPVPTVATKARRGYTPRGSSTQAVAA